MAFSKPIAPLSSKGRSVAQREETKRLLAELQGLFRPHVDPIVRKALDASIQEESIEEELHTASRLFVASWMNHLLDYCRTSVADDAEFMFFMTNLDVAMLPAEFADGSFRHNYLCNDLGISMKKVRSILRSIKQSLSEGQGCPVATLRILELEHHKVFRAA